MVTNRFVQAGNVRLHIQEWGHVESPLMLFLHGLASSSHMFDLIAPALSQHYHILAVDQRGHGFSDKPNDGYDFETLAQDLDHLLGALGLNTVPLILLGHSWGASTALYYAATRPQAVEKVVLLDGGVRPMQDRYPTWEEAEIGINPPSYIAMTEEKIQSLIRDRWLKDFFRPELESLAVSIFDQSDPQNIHPYLSRANHLKIAFHLWSFQPIEYFSRLRCPVLVIHAIAPGQEIHPDLQKRTQEAEQVTAQGQFKAVWMADTAHDIPWHRPAELNAILSNFL